MMPLWTMAMWHPGEYVLLMPFGLMLGDKMLDHPAWFYKIWMVNLW